MAHFAKGLLLSCCLCMAGVALGTSTYALPQQQPPTQTASPATQATADSSSVKLSSDPISEPSKKSTDRENTIGLHLIENLAKDQFAIWTSPAQLELADADWLFPLGIVTGGMLATDTEFSKHISNSQSRLKNSDNFSNYGLGAMAGVAGGVYLWGRITHDDHKRETGILASEAAIDAYAATTALKYAFGRERPLTDEFQGAFWAGGNSFPSEHAATAWSIAGILAHEYPGPLTEILAYGMATGVSLARVTAKEHFPSDVLVGSAIGWLTGQLVYRNHHDPDLGGSTWETYAEARDYLERDRPRQSMGTTYVPLDSWVYPTLDRLAGLGYVRTAIAGLKPWTRMECARLTEEASEELQEGEVLNDQAAAMQDRLRREFSYELGLLDGGRNLMANLESAYVRTVSISGPALSDGYHFGQTVSYDFGRPFERGTNGQAGGAVQADMGPIAIYVRAEYQHAPSAPAPSDAVRTVISQVDVVPEPPAVPVGAINRPRLLDAYVAVNVDNWQISIGKESLEWAPGIGGSLLYSDNAEPVGMVRLVNSEPILLPSILKYLGPMRIDQFIGRLGGHPTTPRPFLYGNKISFKPLPNLEFGFGRTVTIGGAGSLPGNVFTAKNFLLSFIGQTLASTNSVPGDSHTSFDWTFYVPKVQNYIVFYGELYADDDPVPFFNLPKNPFRPGIYITRIPGIPKLDLHIEAANTLSPGYLNGGADGRLNYWNFGYRDGYTNDGQLIGNTVGRMGQAYQGWLTYWISPRNTLQLSYKNSSVARQFIPGGGAWQDYSFTNETYLKSGFYAKALVQYEYISRYPLLFNGRQNNVTAQVELGYFNPGKKE